MMPRLRCNGPPDCPGAWIQIDRQVAVVDEAEVKDLVQAVERLQREEQALRQEMGRWRCGQVLGLVPAGHVLRD